MPPTRSLRFPLVPGDSAIGATLALGVVGMLLWVHRFFVAHLSPAVSIALALLKVAWLFGLVPWMARFVWRRRASDVVLGPEGVAVVGGRHHGRRFTWVDVAAGPGEVVVEGGVHQLRIAGATVAETGSAEEAASLEALAVTLRAATRDLPALAAAPLGPEVLRCDACGAPIVPCDAPRATCAHCGAQVALPEAVRAIAARARRAP